MLERGAGEEAGGVEQGQGCICRADEERQFRAAKDDAVAALTLQVRDVVDYCGAGVWVEMAVYKFVEDDLVDIANNGIWRAMGRKIVYGESKRVNIAAHQRRCAEDGETGQVPTGVLCRDDLGDGSQGRGLCSATRSNAWWMVLSGQMSTFAPAAVRVRAEHSMSAATLSRSSASSAAT